MGPLGAVRHRAGFTGGLFWTGLGLSFWPNWPKPGCGSQEPTNLHARDLTLSSPHSPGSMKGGSGSSPTWGLGGAMFRGGGNAALVSAELSHSLTVLDRCRPVSKPAENRPSIVWNRCAPVCGYRAGYFGLGFASFQAQIRAEIEDFWLDP